MARDLAMSGERRPADLTTEKYAFIAAQVAVHNDRPIAEVLAPFGFSAAVWEMTVIDWTRRMATEIRERSGTGGPIELRYPLVSAYSSAYALAVREAREELDRGEDEATVRIAPGTPLDEPFSVLGASNRAAAQGRAGKGKTAP
jgi:hypothetical protein